MEIEHPEASALVKQSFTIVDLWLSNSEFSKSRRAFLS